MQIIHPSMVSNGHGWRFYKWKQAAEIYRTDLPAIGDLSRLLSLRH